MATILDDIIRDKRKEIGEKRFYLPVSALEQKAFFKRETLSLKASLLDESKTGIIAEFKRRSPSKGNFALRAKVEEVTKAYAEHGASGLSILTDTKYFAGDTDDLESARKVNKIPILRKDFIIDEYQIIEAKAIGADVILLIAECLPKEYLKKLAATARGLGLEVLMEVHNEEELDKWTPDITMVGVNNRNLKDFTVDINRSLELLDKMPAEAAKVAESGISEVQTIIDLKQAGFNGFLIGERFMKTPDPAKAFAEFAEALTAKAQS